MVINAAMNNQAVHPEEATPLPRNRKMDPEIAQMTGELSMQLAFLATRASIDKMADNPKILDLSKHSTFTDFFVICSAISDRKVQAISDSILHQLSQAGRKPTSLEGYSEGRWVLMDYGDIVVHIFQDTLRKYYDLEGLWKDAPQIQIPAVFFAPAASPTSDQS